MNVVKKWSVLQSTYLHVILNCAACRHFPGQECFVIFCDFDELPASYECESDDDQTT